MLCFTGFGHRSRGVGGCGLGVQGFRGLGFMGLGSRGLGVRGWFFQFRVPLHGLEGMEALASGPQSQDHGTK